MMFNHRGISPIRMALAALILCAAAITIAPALLAQDMALAARGEPVQATRFESAVNWVIVNVRLDNSRPLRCILDTGMPNGLFIFDPDLGEELGLKYVSTASVKGAGSKPRTANISTGKTLRLDDLEFKNQTIIVLTEAGELSEMGIDGVIGATVFSRYIVEIDFDESLLTLYDPKTTDPGPFGDMIPLKIFSTKPHIQSEVSIDGGRPTRVSLMVDTGASATLNLFPPSRIGLRRPKESIPAVVAAGVGGDVNGVIGRVSTLNIGAYQFTNAIAGFSPNPIRNENGNIGMGLLRRFIITFDYTNDRMFLRPSKSFDDPFEISMAGLRTRPHAGGGAVIRSIIKNSPAAREDIRSGDILVAINGRKILPSDGPRVHQMLQQHGESVTLTIIRDGKSRDVTLTLKRLI